jgi:PilZ domain
MLFLGPSCRRQLFFHFLRIPYSSDARKVEPSSTAAPSYSFWAHHQRRRLQRRTRHHLSWISFDRSIKSFECEVMDISADGAKLTADIFAPIGSRFRLSAVPQAIVRRSCEVVWRKGRMIGVRFVPEITEANGKLP